MYKLIVPGSERAGTWRQETVVRQFLAEQGTLCLVMQGECSEANRTSGHGHTARR